MAAFLPVELFVQIFSLASVRDIVRCWTLSIHASTVLKKVLSDRIDSLMRPYARDGKTAELRSLLRTVEGMITGSTALKCLLGDVDWRPTDLDIVVPEGRSDVSLSLS